MEASVRQHVFIFAPTVEGLSVKIYTGCKNKKWYEPKSNSKCGVMLNLKKKYYFRVSKHRMSLDRI